MPKSKSKPNRESRKPIMSIRLSAEARRWLTELAQAQGRSQSSVVEAALEKYYEERKEMKMKTNLEKFLEHDRLSRLNWRMAWHGNRQDDSPTGRWHDAQALEHYRALSDAERAGLPETTRQEYDCFIEEAEIAGDDPAF